MLDLGQRFHQVMDLQFHSVLVSSDSNQTPLHAGLDIVEDLERTNTDRFWFHTNKVFAAWDFALCPLPRHTNSSGALVPFDLVHVRDVVQHLPVNKGLAALQHVIDSGAKYMIGTTFPVSSLPEKSSYQNTGASGWFGYVLSLHDTRTRSRTRPSIVVALFLCSVGFTD